MGFLRFLKRDKKEEHSADLDMPPEPPRMEGFDDLNFDMPDFGQKVPQGGDLPDFDFPKESMPVQSSKFIEPPSLPEFEEPVNAKPSLFPMHELPPTPPELPEDEDDEKSAQPAALPSISRAIPEPSKSIGMPDDGNLYVRADKYRDAISNLSQIRNSLRKSEEDIVKMDGLKNSKDKAFDRFKSSLDDLQRKLIFVDKTLFKGD